MKREKVVEVYSCDICNEDDAIWKCVNCGKDVCRSHARVYSLSVRQPENPTQMYSLTLGGDRTVRTGLLCPECVKVIEEWLTKFGFTAAAHDNAYLAA